MEQPIQPIVPEGTPLPPAPVGVPPFPITPFSVWTWNSPVIPNFYWNVYSAEQRIKSICKEIGRIEAYLQYLVDQTNKNFIEVHNRIDALTERVADLERHVEEEVARLDDLIAQLRADLTKEIADREAADDALDDRIDQEINDRQAADNVLHEEIAQEVRDRTHADDELHNEISTETQNRIHADDALGARIDAEAQARQAADAGLHSEIAAEATSRAHGDEALHTEISQETQDRIHADTALEAKLEAELQAEADAREAGDSALRESISTETTERKAADAALGQRITQETSDREAGDFDLNTKIATEAYAREVADDELANEIADETHEREAGDAALRSDLTAEEEAREAGDTALENKISKRLLPSEVLAGNEIEITKDPDSNEITISSTVAHSIDNLETLITSIQSALTAETNERRADDESLWTAVNERIERGKILAGAGIKVENDPDESTVTISATGSIEGTAPVEVTGTPEDGYTIGVSEATETEAGIITEARVKDLGIKAADKGGLTIDEDRRISINHTNRCGGWSTDSHNNAKIWRVFDPNSNGLRVLCLNAGSTVDDKATVGGGIKLTASGASNLHISVAAGRGLEIGETEDDGKGYLRAKTATEESAGIISEARVKELAGTVVPNLSAEYPLKLKDGQLSATPYPVVEGKGPIKVRANAASTPGGEETGMRFSVGVDTATENEAGVITEARVKELIAEAIAAALAQNPTE